MSSSSAPVGLALHAGSAAVGARGRPERATTTDTDGTGTAAAVAGVARSGCGFPALLIFGLEHVTS